MVAESLSRLLLTLITRTNLYSNDGSNGDHPKLYIAKWHHSIHTSPHTDTFKNTCSANANVDFRNDDYYWLATDWLEDGNSLDRK